MTFRPVGHRDRRPGHVASSCYATFQSYRPGQCCGNKDQNPRDRGDTSATLWPRSVICLTASDLIPSGVSLLTHGTSYWASGMRLRGVYKMRAFTPCTVAGPRSPQAQTLNDCLERGAKTHGNVGRQHFGPAISAEVRESIWQMPRMSMTARRPRAGRSHHAGPRQASRSAAIRSNDG